METRNFSFISPNDFCVLILPMRNGNSMKLKRSGILNSGSYPTYEEWKPNFIFTNFNTSKVLILPMRNGNPPYSQYFKHIYIVLILPMRNGNFMLKVL